VPNVPEILKAGLFAKGSIITGIRDNVLLIPRSAIDRFDLAARTGTLFVVEYGIARRRDITSGIVNGEQVEIIAGLKKDELFVVRGAFNLKDGDRVSVASASTSK
jgi:multidrug efflux pump subunit AcrA (membrane-fusion protein)